MAGAIHFEGVWKKFERGERHDSLRDLVPALARSILRPRRRGDLEREEFWALRDVSFEVRPGEVLGIMGPNGAGKTTILRVLTRLLRPNRGRCEVRGRIGALIDVAGGFHPDLTGRENLYLKGSIMGMKRAEIERHFDEIVAFAGLSDFMDTPVKRYSSGMSARLGFSVAAHLEPEVLVIDEVLSVGDAAFQRKAFERIHAMVGSGIPAIVVSHQLERLASLCNQALLLAGGRVVLAGEPADCIAAYTQTASLPTTSDDSAGAVRLERVGLVSARAVRSGERIRIRIEGRVLEGSLPDLRIVGVRVRELESGEVVFACGTRSHGITLPGGGAFALAVELQMNVPPGIYAIETYFWHRERDREVLNGPATTVQVDEGTGFWGTIQLNACMKLIETQAGSEVLEVPEASRPR